MNAVVSNILLILVFIIIGGVFAAAEMALVSLRESQVKQLSTRGTRGKTVAGLAANPNRFLSAVQIGITLVGILSGAFSGATLGTRLSATLYAWGLSESLADTLGVGGVVMGITYMSLVFGELVPKQIALRAPEASAVRIAPLLQVISLVASPLVWVLDRAG